jgi:transcriptional regulator with XRE-family HTH domain
MIITTAAHLQELGKLLADRRAELGWTQQGLAERARVSQGALSQFEASGTGFKFDRLVSVLETVGWGLEVVVREEVHDEQPT